MLQTSDYRNKFIGLLRELFQFDCADLDFGIYRIMNHKRDVIEKFISNDLPKAITKELETGVLADQSEAAKELTEVADRITESLGKDALDADGNLAEAYHGTPLGKKYLDLKRKAAGGRGQEALEAVIFNHLYSFFSRYYQEGDFISKRRYSKRQKYAIPYNGEEVYLHWANHDQYYVKTAEHFNDYSFNSQGVAVHFKLKAADVEQNNVKGDKRFFIPLVKQIEWREKANELVILFEYRPLTEQEEITFGKKNQQDAIIAAAVSDIPKRLKTEEKALLALTSERRKTADGEPVSYLEHHLRQYTRRNTSDFFIHKNLKGFLSRELDFYLKNEVLNLDEMEVAGEDRAEGWFQIIRVIKAVGSRIIDFLDQIESFQKMLWEKRKFITETQYLITVGNIDEKFYPDIASCEEQWQEWKELFHIDEEKTDLFTNGKSKKERRIAFLQAHPTLVVDTKRFDTDVKSGLMGGFHDLGEMTNGLLVHGENWSALSLMLEAYRSSVHFMYCDPPYNTGKGDFLYKDGYQHSSWLAMMTDRAKVARQMMADDGLFTSSIADHEVDRMRLCLSSVFGRDNMLANFIWNNEGNIDNQSRVKENHEYILAFCKDEASYPHAQVIAPDIGPDSKLYNETIENSITKNGPGNPPSEVVLPKGFPATFKEGELDKRQEEWPHLRDRIIIRQAKIVKSARVYSGWSSRYLLDKFIENDCNPIRDAKGLETWFKLTHTGAIYCYKTRESQSHVLSVIRGVGTVKKMSGQLANMGFSFSYPKPIKLIEYVCRWTNHANSLVVDPFSGSGTTGHAVINLNREDEGERQFILVEMGDYFDTVLLPRIKKVTFTPEWKDGKPKRMATPEEAEKSPRIIKYIRLESYEDALNNIQFEDASGQEAMKFEDYLLKYMLKWETKHSETLLNVEKLTKPFSYKLNIHQDGQTHEKAVDIPETFNYLLGLHVKTRKVYNDEARRYLVYRGRIDHRQVVIIWRETEGWKKADLERDKKFVAEEKLTEGADEVFVNGDSFIANAKALEPIFKARMFAPVEA